MFILIFNQLMKMLVIMILAFICYRIKLINQEGNKSFSKLLLMVVNPCLILTVYQTDYKAELARGLLLSMLSAVIAHAIAILVCNFLIPSKGNKDYSIERFASVYSNCGFMGIPLINSVLGSQGVFYLTGYMAVFNLLTWTHGLGLMEEHFSLKGLKKGILSPVFVCTMLAMLLFFLQIQIPSTLLSSMNYLADMNTPLAMMIAGFSVAQADLKKICTNLRIYWVSTLKLLIVPLTVLVFLWLARIDSFVAYVTLIAAACPTATNTTMMAILYDKNYTYASELFAFTTLFSMVSLPCIAFIAGFLI